MYNNSAGDASQEVIFISSESEDDHIVPQDVKAKITSHNNTSSAEDNSIVNNSNCSIPNEIEKATEDQSPEAQLHIDCLFEKFINICIPLIQSTKDASEIIEFIKSRHAHSSADFKASPRYRTLLNRCIGKLSTDCNQEFVYINEVATILGQHSERKRRRISLTQCSTTSNKQDKLTPTLERKTTGNEDEAKKRLEAPHEAADNLQDKIEHYEKLLKRFSDEIKRLQAHELSFDEMEQEDSTYIQEAKLKKKAMKVFEKLCAIKKVKPKTGRVTEQKILLTSSRFPEVNRKVESYVNRVRKFPDFYDIKYLVKRANEQHKLHLDRADIESTSKALFEEVGNHLQRTRQYDFVYNFGSYLTDSAMESKVCDPAEADAGLLTKLKDNRIKSKAALDDVINKFSKQQEVEGTNHSSKDASEIESHHGSDPPTESSCGEESEGTNSDENDDPNSDEKLSTLITSEDGQ